MLYARGRSGCLRVMLPAGRECSIPICGRIKTRPFLKLSVKIRIFCGVNTPTLSHQKALVASRHPSVLNGIVVSWLTRPRGRLNVPGYTFIPDHSHRTAQASCTDPERCEAFSVCVANDRRFPIRSLVGSGIGIGIEGLT